PPPPRPPPRPRVPHTPPHRVLVDIQPGPPLHHHIHDASSLTANRCQTGLRSLNQGSLGFVLEATIDSARGSRVRLGPRLSSNNKSRRRGPATNLFPHPQ